MRILVTGGAGFIGSHVVDAYIRAGHDVWVLDDLSRGKRENVNPHARFIRMDLRSPDLKDLLAEGSFDCVSHHAAQIDVRVSVLDPARDAMVNIVGTLNLLEAMRRVGFPRLIFASTGGAIYGEQHHYPATEQHPAVPLSPYGVTKLAVEHYLEYYRQVHGMKYVVLRYANVYGPRQDPEGEAGVVAIFCRKILRGQRLIIYGDGEQTRDYVYVEDVARANLLALDYPARQSVESPQSVESVESKRATASAESVEVIGHIENGAPTRSRLNRLNGLKSVFNVGTGVETSVNALAATLLEAADADCPIMHQPARPGEQLRSVIDPSRADQVLGWKPAVPVIDGLSAVLAWFRSQEIAASSRQQAGDRN